MPKKQIPTNPEFNALLAQIPKQSVPVATSVVAAPLPVAPAVSPVVETPQYMTKNDLIQHLNNYTVKLVPIDSVQKPKIQREKKVRTAEEQEIINIRMKKLRDIRLAKIAEKKAA